MYSGNRFTPLAFLLCAVYEFDLEGHAKAGRKAFQGTERRVCRTVLQTADIRLMNAWADCLRGRAYGSVPAPEAKD